MGAPRTRIVAAMSGGVDSSVTAALLARAGYEVIGVTLQLYSAAIAKRKGACCAGQDIHDARRVAEKLGLSRTPVREALGRLAGEGYLRRDGRVLLVTGVAVEEIMEILAVRRVLEVGGSLAGSEKTAMPAVFLPAGPE